MPPPALGSKPVVPTLSIFLRKAFAPASSFFSSPTGTARLRDEIVEAVDTSGQADLVGPAGSFRVLYRDDWSARTGYTCVSLFCMLILAFMLGTQIPSLA
jgi:hypothetical protein